MFWINTFLIWYYANISPQLLLDNTITFSDIDKLINSGQISSSLVPTTLSNEAIIMNARKEETLVTQMMEDLQIMKAFSPSISGSNSHTLDFNTAFITGFLNPLSILLISSINVFIRSHWICGCIPAGWNIT